LAQFTDDFSDGDFTNNPSWSGDDNQFKISTFGNLQLDGTNADTSYLSIPSTIVSNTEWRFYAKQSFNSSDNNHSRIYLVSSNQDLEGNLNGYFLEFGSSDDNLKLIRQDGIDTTVLINGSIFTTGNSVNEFTFKITRSQNGEWELFADDQAGNNFISEGVVVDTVYQTSNYFGVFCKYTSSNSTKVYFDDFYVGSIQIDTIPPSLESLSIINTNKLELSFSEILDTISAKNPVNYNLDNSIGMPTSISMGSNNSIVILEFSSNFPEDILLTVQISNIADNSGNIMPTHQESFAYHITKAFDILINEIMADPSPVVLLPDVEYIELYNNSDFPIDLDGWFLQIGETKREIENISLESKSFLILGHQNSETDLNQYGDFYGFSSMTLRNSGESLKLIDDKNRMIHSVDYDEVWYKSSTKSDGGWSLEMIDPNNPCQGFNNWIASNDNSGGTPGRANSVLANNPDTIKPKLHRAAIENPISLKLYFSEKMDSASILNTNAYFVDNSIGKPAEVILENFDYSYAILRFNNSFQNNTIYKLSVKDSLKDCVGNMIEINSETKFAYSEMPDSNDIIINEILFNPNSASYDFVELYNKSDKVIDLKFVFIGRKDLVTNQIIDKNPIVEESYLFFPHEYIVVSENPESVMQEYYTKVKENCIKVNSLITMPNAEGNVSLMTVSEQIIDEFDYSEDMHFGLISNPRGISLERVNYNLPASNPSNWHSASSLVGYATPTYKNSQFSEKTIAESDVKISPEIFSPDNDGYNDLLKISINSKKAGKLATIRIYNSSGQLVRELETNAIIGHDAIFFWDGIKDDNTKASLGIYVIYIEIIDANGNIEHFKKAATLGGKF